MRQPGIAVEVCFGKVDRNTAWWCWCAQDDFSVNTVASPDRPQKWVCNTGIQNRTRDTKCFQVEILLNDSNIDEHLFDRNLLLPKIGPCADGQVVNCVKDSI